MLKGVTRLVSSHCSGGYSALGVDIFAEVNSLIAWIIEVGKRTVSLQNLDIGDAILPKHTLGDLSTRYGQRYLTVLLEFILESATNNVAKEGKSTQYNPQNHISLVLVISKLIKTID